MLTLHEYGGVQTLTPAVMRSASEGVEDDAGVDEHCDRDECHDGDDCSRGGAAAIEAAELDLDHVDEGEGKEAAPEHGSDCRREDPAAEQSLVDPGGAPMRAHYPDRLLEAEGDEAGEEEGGEGEDVEGDEILGDAVADCAVGVGESAVGIAGGVPGEAHEDGEGEEGVDVDDTVEGRDVDAGASAGSCRLETAVVMV